MNELKVEWKKSKAPSYSKEELESIYKIKENHTILSFKKALSWDLMVSLLIASGFIVLLQVAQLSTGNFWSLIMAFVAIQHIVLHAIQVRLINRRILFKHNVAESINKSIKQLRLLLWHYRIWPPILGIILYIGYIYWFSPAWGVNQMILQAIAIVFAIGIISNILSAIIVRKQLSHLRRLANAINRE